MTRRRAPPTPPAHRTAVIGAVVASVTVGYLGLLRPWASRWGATRQEASRPMPGDDIVARPHLAATRAVTVTAPPEKVWPWLAQIGGYPRAGWYGYDRLDNGGHPSAEVIVPELQRLAVGDVLPTDRDGTGFVVVDVEPPDRLLASMRGPDGVVSWLATLSPLDGGRTRMIARTRVRARPTPRGLALLGLIEFGDFVMTRRTLLGIKRRAEGTRVADGPSRPTAPGSGQAPARSRRSRRTRPATAGRTAERRRSR